MDYKEKYEKALERAKELRNNPFAGYDGTDVISSIFPELAESEDKKIRKGIIRCVKDNMPDNVFRKKYLAWLEKQGEQKIVVVPKFRVGDKVKKGYLTYTVENIDEDSYKLQAYSKDGDKGCTVFLTIGCEKDYELVEQNPADNVEPKFKVGNWYQCTKDFFGKGVTFDKNTAYYCAKEGCLQNEYGCHIAIVKDLYDNFKLWTIQDAKDGDVLATPDYILIFKQHLEDNGGVSYCHYDFTANTPRFMYLEDKNWYFGKEAIVHPATKEQRNLLFQKMKEAGYEWYAEKKELRKIEQKPVEWDESIIDETISLINKLASGYGEKVDEPITFNGVKMINNIKERLRAIKPQPKKEWSEKDEKGLGDALWCCKQAASIAKDENDMGNCWYAENWLKSLKDRVQPQPKQEWSEDDKNRLNRLIAYFEDKESFSAEDDLIYASWLKSLRPQKQWKVVDKEIYVKEPALAQRKDKSAPNHGYVICYDHTLTPDVYERFIMISDIIRMVTRLK